MAKTPLPIDPFLPAITQDLCGVAGSDASSSTHPNTSNGALVLVAEPGAGKTTRVPPAVLQTLRDQSDTGQVLLLQPRRVAAKLAAERMAEENGWRVGEEVGYHVRFDRKVGPKTGLIVLTEGLLNRRMVADPFLEGVSCVILDEFHERSLDVDLAIAMLQEVRQAGRDDLKLLVMSATLDAQRVAAYLNDAPIHTVPGRTFPVRIEHIPATPGSPATPRNASGGQSPVWEQAARAVTQWFAPAVDANPPAPNNAENLSSGGSGGGGLVFVAGVLEIRRTLEQLGGWAQSEGVSLFGLHGSMPLAEQQRVLKACGQGGQRFVVVATNIAETSLTIPGVKLVVDTGFMKQSGFDASRGVNALGLVPISKAAADQRAGRAGRTQAGVCVRLWSKQEHAARPSFDAPEIGRVDLSQTLLALRAFGVPKVDDVLWFEAPPKEAVQAAEALLAMLDATDGPGGALTALGEQMAALPVHPRVARLLLQAACWGEQAKQRGTALAAIVSEGGFEQRGNRSPAGTDGLSDLTTSVDALLSGRAPGWADAGAFARVQQVREQLMRLLDGLNRNESANKQALPNGILMADLDGLLPMFACPDRVCLRREQDRKLAAMAGGGSVRLLPSSVVQSGDWLVAVSLQDTQQATQRLPWFRNVGQQATVHAASRIEADWIKRFLKDQLVESNQLVFDVKTWKVWQTRTIALGQCVLSETKQAPAADGDTAACLAQGVWEHWLQVLAEMPGLAAWLKRLRFVAHHAVKLGMADADQWSMATDGGLQQAIEQACMGQTRFDAKTMGDVLMGQLLYAQQMQLNQWAPDRFQTPAGPTVKIEYPDDPSGLPVLGVQLQAVFGQKQTPFVMDGRVPVVLHLLAPNQRPVQVTQDLASFWQNTYPQVRKDLRARYAKHAWPEDPTVAEPSAKGMRRR